MRKENILRSSMYLLSVISLAIFITTKSGSLMKAATEGMYADGDLYRFAKVRSFKTPLPLRECEGELRPTQIPDSASFILIGDSFIEDCRGHKPFPVLLSEKLHKNVYPVYAGNEPEYFDPAYFCWSNSVGSGKKKIVIVECVERYIIKNFVEEENRDTSAEIQPDVTEADHRWHTVRNRLFVEAEKNYEIFFSSSRFTAPFVEIWNTLRFTIFGRISDETPVYSVHPPFLFYKEEVRRDMNTSFYYPHPESLVALIANNIAAMSKQLRARSNAELIFVPVPNAYTLYHTMVNSDPYDGFLPRLCVQLNKRGVRTVDLYGKFSTSNDILFLPTDTHWNAKGAALAAEQVTNELPQHDGK